MTLCVCAPCPPTFHFIILETWTWGCPNSWENPDSPGLLPSAETMAELFFLLGVWGYQALTAFPIPYLAKTRLSCPVMFSSRDCSDFPSKIWSLLAVLFQLFCRAYSLMHKILKKLLRGVQIGRYQWNHAGKKNLMLQEGILNRWCLLPGKLKSLCLCLGIESGSCGITTFVLHLHWKGSTASWDDGNAKCWILELESFSWNLWGECFRFICSSEAKCEPRLKIVPFFFCINLNSSR